MVKRLNILWKNVLDPLVDLIMSGVKLAFELFAIAIKNLSIVLSPLISVLSWLWKNILEISGQD